MLIRACVDKVFIPHAMVHISEFLLDYKNKLIYTHDYKQAFGFQITLPPSTLDLRHPAEELEKALMTSFKTYDDLTNKKQ